MTPKNDDPYLIIEKLESQIRRKDRELEKLTKENKSLKDRLSAAESSKKDDRIKSLTAENTKLKEKQALKDIFSTE